MRGLGDGPQQRGVVCLHTRAQMPYKGVQGPASASAPKTRLKNDMLR